MAQVIINAGDAIRVTEQETLAGSMLLLWVNNLPRGHITREEAERLRAVVKDPSKIGGQS